MSHLSLLLPCSVKGIDATAARTLASLLRCGVGRWALCAGMRLLKQASRLPNSTDGHCFPRLPSLSGAFALTYAAQPALVNRRDLSQLDITPVVTGAAHRPSIRPLLLAHGTPLPPEPAASAEAASPFLLHSTAVAAAAGLAAPQQHCHEFGSYEEGLRFCESQLLAVAGR